jgi:hypothetical protein
MTLNKVFRLKTVFVLALTVGLTLGALTGSGFYAIRGNRTMPKSAPGRDPQALAASAEPWKFGVMSDTQWRVGDPDPANCPLGDTLDCDGKNPNGVAVGIINELNKQFISHGVKFVIQTGDLTDTGDPRALDTAATFRQELYDAGIGFYPLRGNHDASKVAAVEFQRIFPQTQTGVNNQTPASALITTLYYGPPHANTNKAFTVGSNFASPSTDFAGLTYSFDYDNARFVLLDQFTPPDGSSHSALNSSDVNWVDTRLASRPAGTHAFVFGHKHLISENHPDTLFGSDPSDNHSGLQDLFIASLYNNGVRYYMGGHDHLHNRAIVTSPNGVSSVQDIITSSNSFKSYVPQVPSNDYRYNVLVPPESGTPSGKSREIPIAQELFTIGYYIVTVDGPRVTVDYYSSPDGCDGDCNLTNMPAKLTFSKRETFGYSLNGKEFLVPEGGSYTEVQDSFGGTKARILSGINSGTARAYDNRALTKAVDTGWTPRTPRTDIELASDILTLWGMAKSLGDEIVVIDGQSRTLRADQTVRSDQTDEYVLSMTYDSSNITPRHLANYGLGIATHDENGNWVNAVDRNFGGSIRFVSGPWQSKYELGAYGVDLKTQTAWAVINCDGDFAVTPGYRWHARNGVR